MKNYQIILIGVYFLMTVGACKKNQAPEDAIRNIPGDVTMLTTINMPSLMKKMDFETVRNLPFYAESAKKVNGENALMSMIMMDPAKSGIDLSKNIYLVGYANPEGEGAYTIGTVCSIKDQKAFTEMMNAGNKSAKATQTNGIWSMGDDSGDIVSWNNQIAVLLTGSESDNNRKFADMLFKGTPANSVANNKDLAKLLAEKHDISAWVNSNALAAIRDIKFGAGSVNIKAEDLKDNYIHAYADFENGQIVSENRFFLKKGLIKDISLLVKDNVKTDFSAYFPDNATSATALALDFNGFRQVMSENIMMKKAVTTALEDTGLTFDEVTKALQGDILMTSFMLNEQPSGLIAMKINDKNIIQKLIGLGLKYGMLEKAGTDMYKIAYAEKADKSQGLISGLSVNSDTRILIYKDMLILAYDDAAASKILAGGFKDSGAKKKEMLKMMNSNLIASIMNPYDLMPAATKKEMTDIVKEFKLTVNRKGSETKVIMKDQNTNSLKAIIQAMNDSYMKNKSEAKGENI